MNLNDLWAKTNPRESLLHHMKAVGNTAVKVLTDSSYDGLMDDMCEWSNLEQEDLIKFVRYIAAMHDIGKAHPSFQIKDGNPLPEGYEDETIPYFRHEIAVLDIAPEIWSEWDGRTRRTLAKVLSLHHQHKNKACAPVENKKWEELWIEIETEIRDWSGFNTISLKTFNNTDSFCTILTSLIILSDWIASSNEEDKAIKGLGLTHHEKLQPFDFKERFGYDPRISQQTVIEKVNSMSEMPLTMIIEAPPGEGKTELAMWLAHKMGNYWNKNGIYFALPTAATSNQMVGRVRNYLKNDISHANDVALMHAMEWLEDTNEEMPPEERVARDEWKAPQKRALLSRYAVGTVDQVMLSVLKVRYGTLRLFGLSNKVVIIDEIHAYDAYMTEIIKRLTEWLRALKVPVIMLSATLPSERKRNLLDIELPLNEYPLVTSIFADGHAEQFVPGEVFRHMETEIEIVKDFDNIKMPEGMNCILVNTVDKAQKIFDKIDGPKMLFHGRFTAKRRKEIEDEVLRMFSKDGERGNMTLVATQVVEQSLDVDFDYLVTELAPIDLIFQRLGRLHRHDILGRGDPKCTIFYEKDKDKKYGKSEYIYPTLLLERTERALNGVKSLKIPDDIRSYIENVYSEEVDADLLEEFLSRSQENKMQEFEAMIRVLNAPVEMSFCLYEGFEAAGDDETAAKTRLGSGYKLCILPKDLYDEAIDQMNRGISADLAKKINEYAISVSKDYEGIEGKGKLSGYKLRIGTPNPATETSFSATETSYSLGYKEKLIFDKEKGLCSTS